MPKLAIMGIKKKQDTFNESNKLWHMTSGKKNKKVVFTAFWPHC